MSSRIAPDCETVDRIVTRLFDCRSILFVTGAGMSAESGLPTYRGVGGLYSNSETEEGTPIENMLSGEMFAQRPEWTWKYLRQVGKCL
jgi:NAD-dependent deacetylase